jgi:apolipoprotein N-acyltransferase
MLSLAALFLLCARTGPKRAFAIGWAYGLGYFAFSLAWIAESFTVDAARYGWMAAPAVGGLSALLALFPGLACAAFVLARAKGLLSAAIFATCWTAAEWLRGHVASGFPWNLAGYVFADIVLLRQPAAWFGAYGLGFLLAFLSTAPVTGLRDGAPRRVTPLVSTIAISLALVGAGWLRLADAPAPRSEVRLRIVQGAIPQTDKWRPELREAIFTRHLRLSAKPGVFDVLLWPEAAFPGYLDEDPVAIERIAGILAPGQRMLTGSPDRRLAMDGLRFFNTIQAYDTSGGPRAVYAKHHLVPFGEYTPPWLPIARLVETPGDFTPGPGPHTLILPGLPPVGAAICYEIAFPGHVIDDATRPDWIFNATNDAWFGESAGPHQHLAAARMRAVETGLPVVRAANTGVSAVIDADGRILDRLDLGQMGVIDAVLPPSRPPPLYARIGDYGLPPLVLTMIALAWLTDRTTPPGRRRSRQI